MKLNEFYMAVDGNYEDAMARLQNEMFVGKFLRMLPRDGSMMLLEKAMADGRANDAFRAVHTLKGIALNLSLTKLAAACSQLTEALRGADTIPQQARELLIPVRQEYARIRAALEELDAYAPHDGLLHLPGGPVPPGRPPPLPAADGCRNQPSTAIEKCDPQQRQSLRWGSSA